MDYLENGQIDRVAVNPLEELYQQRAEVQHPLNVVTKDIDTLGQLVNFPVVSEKLDLKRGGLNAESLTNLTTYSMKQGRELAAEQFRHQKQLSDLEKQLQQVTRSKDLATRVSTSIHASFK